MQSNSAAIEALEASVANHGVAVVRLHGLFKVASARHDMHFDTASALYALGRNDEAQAHDDCAASSKESADHFEALSDEHYYIQNHIWNKISDINEMLGI